MKLTSINVYSANVEMFSFALAQIDVETKFYVKNMTGLDAEELIPRFYGFGLKSKGKFYDFMMKPRTIVIRFSLNPRFKLDESYSDLRDRLYRSISSFRESLVYLHFNSSGSTVAKIAGYITKFEVPYFTPLPEVQLTIRCDDPILRGINPVSFQPSELIKIDPLIIPDSLSTAPHGFKLEVSIIGATNTLVISDNSAPENADWKFSVTPDNNFIVGDIVTLSSEFAEKELYMTRAGVVTQLANKILPDSIWPTIFPGVTQFYFYPSYNYTLNSLEYYPAYWGV